MRASPRYAVPQFVSQGCYYSEEADQNYTNAATIRRASGAVRGSVAGVAVVERSSNAYENR